MKTTDFDYNLPKKLIAHYPTPKRTASRLMALGEQAQHRHFSDFPHFLEPGDLLVFNNSRVIAARLFGVKETGGKVEVLVERVVNEYEVLAHVRASKSPKPGGFITFDQKFQAEMLGRQGELFQLKFSAPVLGVLNQIGHVPLPPYIERTDEGTDHSRYQTVYAKHDGSVAAPTAGLHFDEALLEEIKIKGIDIAFVTLHVGAGTFQPVRADNVEEHHMHAELIDVSQAVCDKVRATKAAGRRVIAVGTTSVRCLETANGKPFLGETDIFIYPGYQFNTVDALITNFHLPKSSLLMLVCAFAGYERVMNAYQIAIEKEYRFFSYGDACFFEKSLD